LQGPHLTNMTRSETFSEAVRKTVYIYKKLIPKQGWTDDSAELKYLRRYFLYLNIYNMQGCCFQ